jgi:hypothetical protein
MVSIVFSKSTSFQDNLVHFDKVSDYVPVLSTFTNLVDLFQKCVVMRFMKPEDIQKSYYYTHLKNKEIRVCVALLVPVLGNILVYLYQSIVKKVENNAHVAPLLAPVSVDPKTTLRAAMLDAIKEDSKAIDKVPAELKKDSKFMIAAMKIDPYTLLEADEELKKSPDFILEALAENKSWEQEGHKDAFNCICEITSDVLKRNLDFMLKAIRIDSDPLLFTYETLTEEQNNNPEFMLARIKNNFFCGVNDLKKASSELKKDQNFILELIKIDYTLFEYAADELKKDYDFMLKAVQANPKTVAYISWDLEQDKAFMAEVNKIVSLSDKKSVG